jgi:hypothetical protein
MLTFVLINHSQTKQNADAIAYLQEQREIWYSDFHNGAFGDCGKSFTSQVVYERGRKLQYDTRTIIVDVVVDVV